MNTPLPIILPESVPNGLGAPGENSADVNGHVVDVAMEARLLIDDVTTPSGDARHTERHRPLVALNLKEFLNAATRPREHLLAPILSRQSLAMVHAKRGVGKTNFALALSIGVASGSSVLNWSAPGPRRVLYIDGEMPASQMQDRVRSLVAAAPQFDLTYFSIINADLFDGLPPNLSTREGQSSVEPYVEAAELIVIDNLATLTRHGKENETESWAPMQNWLLSLRRRGKSVLLVHHSNKSGAQRGTSSREDILDVVISLSHPSDYEASQGARFIVEFEKARGIFGADADSFEAAMALKDGVAHWTRRPLEDAVSEEVANLRAEGKSFREIATELGISKSAAERACRRHEQARGR